MRSLTEQQRAELEEYERQSVAWANRLMAHGHGDPSDLRDLLILTTNMSTAPAVEAYFCRHHHDATLIERLVAIAAEGDDAGDAPWAAANVLSEFPAKMLSPHRDAILRISQEDWSYLSDPATTALAKIDALAK